MRLGRVHGGDAAIDRDVQMRPLALQPAHQIVIQRRHVAVLLGRQPLQPGLARMDDEDLDPDGGAGVHRGEQADGRVLIVHPDAAFDARGQADGPLDRRHTVGHQLGLAHQTGAEPTRLHPVRRAADVQIDLVIAERLADLGGLGQLRGIRPAQLQGHRMLQRIEPQQPLAIPVQHRRRRHHLGVKQRPARQRSVERPAMPIGPVHHRGDGQRAGGVQGHRVAA